ncbi:siderophore-interacting protein [uncultured Corynebacterium sp.]|uniref:siderophore-interacting protein n=1 Tax=uncultured Corynebacterium sp. TaxID=159447 RepID=UPI0025F104A2|nr:siderophore-interacting protein [uncultured Corynebacterium sp.]
MTTLPASAVNDTDLRTHPNREESGGARLVRVTVAAVSDVAPNLRRLTLSGPGLASLTLTGPDEYLGLLMPAPGQTVPELEAEGMNIRAAVAALDESERPGLRWYTVRHFRQSAGGVGGAVAGADGGAGGGESGGAAGEIDIDVVMHDDHPGPGARWVSGASVGDDAAIWLCNAIWIRHASRPLFVADASAVPALRAILEFTEDHHPDDLVKYHVRVVAHSPEELEPGLAEEWTERVGSLSILYVTPGLEAEAVCDALRRDRGAGHPAASPEYLWASGEAGMTKAVRKMAVDEWDVDRDFADWVAYWIEGRPRP